MYNLRVIYNISSPKSNTSPNNLVHLKITRSQQNIISETKLHLLCQLDFSENCQSAALRFSKRSALKGLLRGSDLTFFFQKGRLPSIRSEKQKSQEKTVLSRLFSFSVWPLHEAKFFLFCTKALCRLR